MQQLGMPPPLELNYSLSETASGPTYETMTWRKVVFADPARDKEIAVRVQAPKARGQYPVIIFSHGAGASKDAYTRLTRYWAACGYICLQPSHDDAPAGGETHQVGDSLSSLVARLAVDAAGWMERAYDLKVLLDKLPQLGELVSDMAALPLTNRVALAGHSYGAFVSSLLMGAKARAGDRLIGAADERPRALLMLSPQGRSQSDYGFGDGAWTELARPSMFMTGSNDGGFHGQPAWWRTEPFHLSPSGNKYLVFIEGADHLSFTGSTLRGLLGAGAFDKMEPGMKNMLEAEHTPEQYQYELDCIKLASRAFFDAYLQSNDEAGLFLSSDRLSKLSQGKVRFLHRF